MVFLYLPYAVITLVSRNNYQLLVTYSDKLTDFYENNSILACAMLTY